MWKINKLTQEFAKWHEHERFIVQRIIDDEVNSKNESVQQIDKSANLKPLVFDVPVVPSKISGIFHKTTGAVNMTALRNLVRKLNSKNIDPLN